jgi:hypothetical protein
MAPAIALLVCGKERLFAHGITLCSVANDLVGLIIDHCSLELESVVEHLQDLLDLDPLISFVSLLHWDVYLYMNLRLLVYCLITPLAHLALRHLPPILKTRHILLRLQHNNSTLADQASASTARAALPHCYIHHCWHCY